MKVVARPFRTHFFLWEGVSALFFSNCVTQPHSHNTLQIVVDLQGAFKCKVSQGVWGTYTRLIIRENAMHQLDTNGSVQLLIYLDADTAIAQELKTKYLGGRDFFAPEIVLLPLLNPPELQRAILEPNPEVLYQLINRILLILAGPKTETGADSRIVEVERLISVLAPEQLIIAFLAKKIFLSESRLRALFKEKTGVPIYKYILWRKIRFAINRIMTGNSVGDAALEAGFTDAPHFHKMLVNMFGVSPSQFIKENQSLKIVYCDQSPLKFVSTVYDDENEVIKVYK
jgi:AraC-like DNA-binding protein